MKFLLRVFCLLLLAGVTMQWTSPSQSLIFAQDGDNAANHEARESLKKGAAYLRSVMKEDSYWLDIRGKSPGYTALATQAMMRAGFLYGKDAQVTKAIDWLASLQQKDGGLYEEDYQNYNTSVIVMALAEADAEKFADTLKKAGMFLKGIQFSETTGSNAEDAGGIGYGSDPSRSDLSNTQYALDALKAAGIPEDDPVYQEALKFISRCQNNSETNDQEWAGNDGGFVYRPGVTKTEDGEWVDAGGQKRVKSYGSMTYAGVKSMIHCGVKKDDPRIQQAIKWIQKNYTLKENPEMAAQGLYYYWHTFGKAMHLLGEDTITDDDGNTHNWRSDLIAEVTKNQSDDGSWVNTKEERWMEGNQILATCYAMLALEWALEK